MDYGKLVKSLRYVAENHSTTSPEILTDAADAIEQLSNAGSAYGRGWTLGYDAGREENKPRWIPVAERLADKYEELLKAAKKMHLWIFLHTGDEQKAYDECGLSDEMNIALGYSGQLEFRAKSHEEDRGCPPDYNPGFCYGDEDCDACWEGWRKEQGG